MSFQHHVVIPPDTGTGPDVSFQLMLIGMCVIWIIWILLLYSWQDWAPKLIKAFKALCQSRPEPAIDYTAANRQQVIGWKYATEQELRALPPAELQQVLDLRNPFWDVIEEHKLMIAKYEHSNWPFDRLRYRVHVAALQVLREQPEALERRVLVPRSRKALVASVKAVHAVRSLPEG